MHFMNGMAVNGVPPVAFGPYSQVPMVHTGAPMTVPPIPHVLPYGAPAGAQHGSCGGCRRGMGAAAPMTTGAKIALGVLGLAVLGGGFMLARNLR